MTMKTIPSMALALVLTLGACGAPDAEEAAAEHPSVVVTQWNDSTELFLEYPVPVAGQAMGNWAIHLSNMKNFKPLTEGVLTVRFLQSGEATQTFTLEAPARDGIYLLDPVIEQPGSYEVQLALRGPQVSSTHVLPEVRVYAEAGEIPPTEEEEVAGAISFLKEQQWKIPFAVEPAAEAEVARTVSAPGEIVAPDGALAVVSAPISGIAQAASNQGAPSIGMAVSAGQVLAVLAPTAGEGGYAQASGELERLTREAERAERLYAAGAIPAKRLEEARHDLEIARAEMAAMGGTGEDGDFRMRVRAPFSGVIAERGFVPGGRVEAGAPLTGGVLNIATLVGFITLFGIAVRNGILLVSHYNHLLAEGVSLHEAVYRGSMERLNPVMMTALSAGLALIPLAVAGGEPGNEIQSPMAIVVLGGLLSAVVLNMVVVPALYLRYGVTSRASPAPDREEAEPTLALEGV